MIPGLSGALPPLASLALVLFLVVWLPGLGAARLFLGRERVAGFPPGVLPALLGLALLSAVLFANQFLDLPLPLLAWLLPAAGLLLFAGARLRAPLVAASRERFAPDLAGAGLLLLLGLAALRTGMHESWAADTWDYLNRARAIQDAGSMRAGSPYGPGLANVYDPSFYAGIALLSHATGLSLVRLWSTLPAFATPLFVLAFLAFARALSNDPRAARTAAIVLGALYAPLVLLRESVNHQRIADALLLGAIALLLRYVRTGRRSLLALGLALSLASVPIHQFQLVQSNALLAGFLVVSLLVPGVPGVERRRAWGVFLGHLALSLPFFLFLLSTRLRGFDPAHMNDFFATEYAPLRSLSKSLYFPDPLLWFPIRHVAPPLLLAPFLVPALRERAGARYLLASLVLPLVLVVNPLTFPLLGKVMGFQVATRLLNLVQLPGACLLGLEVHRVFTRPEGPGAVRLLRRTAVLVSFLLVLLPTGLSLLTQYHPALQAAYHRRNAAAYEDALARVGKATPAGSVILTDPVTGYVLPALAGRHPVSVFRADFSFSTPGHRERKENVREALNPLSGIGRTLPAVRATGAKWLLVNTLESPPLTREKLDFFRPWFEPALEEPPFHLYRVRADLAEDSLSAWDGRYRDRLLAVSDSLSRSPAGGGGEPLSAHASLDVLTTEGSAARVKPGGAFAYSLTIRLRESPETRALFLHFGRGDAYGSPARKFRRYLRKVLGFTDSFFPVEGYLLPFRIREAWQVGLLLREEHRVEVPPNAVPGTYRASLREGGYADDRERGDTLGFLEVAR